MIRTLKELEECEFENLTYGELSEHELDCKKHCPFYGDGCSGGMSCHGGNPVEPMCIIFDDDTVLIDRFLKYQDNINRMEKQKDMRLKKEKEQKNKNAEIARKRHEYKIRNFHELAEISRLEKYIDSAKRLSQFAKIYSESVNAVNEMFRSSGTDCPPDIKPSKKVEELNPKIVESENRIAELKEIIKQKEIEFKKGIV